MKSIKEFMDICKLTQEFLKVELYNRLEALGYDNVIFGNGFVFAKGDIPVLLTAHMDTVHKEPVKNIVTQKKNGKTVISSPQGIGGDDRCGVFMILELLKENKCSVLFCEDEEIGGVGSNKFCESKYLDEIKDIHYMIELDRMNSHDAVFYECDNEEFTEFIEKNTMFKKAYGSFSDISNLMPNAKIAGVNFSCGYYNAHTTNEYVVFEEMCAVIDEVNNLLKLESKQYEYVEMEYTFGDYGFGRFGYYDYGNCTSLHDACYCFTYSEGGEEKTDFIDAYDENEAIVFFFMEHQNRCWNDLIDFYEI